MKMKKFRYPRILIPKIKRRDDNHSYKVCKYIFHM